MSELVSKFCPKCETEKSTEDFNRDSARQDGFSSYCKPCKYQNHLENETPEQKRKQVEATDRWRLNHPERKLKTQVNQDLAKYGINLDEYKRLLENQNYRCAICGAFNTGNKQHKRLCVDHDHKTGKVRGLLCHFCNSVLGYTKDNIQILESAIKYLKGS